MFSLLENGTFEREIPDIPASISSSKILTSIVRRAYLINHAGRTYTRQSLEDYNHGQYIYLQHCFNQLSMLTIITPQVCFAYEKKSQMSK
jgi:hypothetical protein